MTADDWTPEHALDDGDRQRLALLDVHEAMGTAMETLDEDHSLHMAFSLMRRSLRDRLALDESSPGRVRAPAAPPRAASPIRTEKKPEPNRDPPDLAVYNSPDGIRRLDLADPTCSTRRALFDARLLSITDVESKTDAELLRLPGIGPRRLADIRRAIRMHKSFGRDDCVTQLRFGRDGNFTCGHVFDLVGAFGTIDRLEAASDAEILAVPGIGRGRLNALRSAIRRYRAGH